MIIQLLTIISISYLFIHSEPLILLKRYLGFKEERYDEFSKIKRFFYKLITCWMCSAFWIGIFLNIFIGYNLYEIISIAAIASFLSSIIEKLISID